MTHYTISADIGKASDFTAVTVLRIDPPSPILKVIDLQRTRGQSLVEVARVLSRMYSKLNTVHQQELGNSVSLVIDETGMGAGLADILREEGLDFFLGFTITSGVRTRRENDKWYVPKADLVMLTASCLAQGRLKIPKTLLLSETLVKELGKFQMKPTGKGGTKYSAEGSTHDDLVLSLSMAVFYSLACLTGYGGDAPFSGGGTGIPGLPGTYSTPRVKTTYLPDKEERERVHPKSTQDPRWKRGGIPGLP
jgi:hypothetical protein